MSKLMSYSQSLLMVGAVSLLNLILVPHIGYHAAGFVYLLAVTVIGIFLTFGPVLFAAILTALLWDYLFIPPIPDIRVHSTEDLCMMIAYFSAAMITGALTQQIRNREALLKARQSRLGNLYEVVREIASAPEFRAMIEAVTEHVSRYLDGRCTVVLAKDGVLNSFTTADFKWLNQQEADALLVIVAQKKCAAGWRTSFLPEAESLYLPLLGDTGVLGVLVFRPSHKERFLDADSNILFAVTRQLAVSLEREIFQARAVEAQRLALSEKLHQTILDSISHEIRTPLTALIGLAGALVDPALEKQTAKRLTLTENFIESGERLNQVVENLLDMSRISSGKMSLKQDWHDLGDVVSVSVTNLQNSLSRHRVVVKVAENMPLVRLDFHLFEQAVSNLIRNAAHYSPPATEILIEVGHTETETFIEVVDSGPGIPPTLLSSIFEKFYRIPGTKPGGTGLGLTIAKGITEAHGGLIFANNGAAGGACFRIALPGETQPLPPLQGEP